MNLYITDAVWDRMWEYVYAVGKEIGGFGWAFEREGCWTWEHIELPDQETTSSSIEYDEQALLGVLTNAAQAGVLDRDDFCWVVWHSHGNLAVGFSMTDLQDSIDVLGGDGNVKRLFNVIANRKGEYVARVDVWDVPIIGHAYTEDVTLFRHELVPLRTEVYKEVKEKVRSPKPAPPTNGKGQKGGRPSPATMGTDLIPANATEQEMLEALGWNDMDLLPADCRWDDIEWDDPDELEDGVVVTAEVFEDGTVRVKEGTDDRSDDR